jgi:hypothetical protein
VAVFTWTQAVAGTYTWVCPAGVTSAKVECVAGGAGGSGGSSTSVAGSGGGGGEYAAEPSLTVAAGSYTVVVGAAGTAGATAGGAGGAGGSSTFASTSVVAHGGTGGTSGAGGAGGTGSSNTTHNNGGAGGTSGGKSDGGGGGGGSGGSAAAGNAGAASSSSTGGAGGAAVTGGGPGGAGGTSTAAGGTPASGPGGAGGGGGDASVAGGAGKPGRVIITVTILSPALFTSADTAWAFTVPAGITTIHAECWGGGAGGFQTGTSGGAGGGAGAYAGEPSLAVTAAGSYPFTIGAGGASNASGTSSVIAGDAVTVTALHGVVSASDGTGGAGGAAGANTAAFAGGAGGTDGTTGGGGGGGSAGPAAGGNAGSNGSTVTGGAGATAVTGGGPGGGGSSAGGPGSAPASGPGGGGGGAGYTSTTNGAGFAGQVQLTWGTGVTGAVAGLALAAIAGSVSAGSSVTGGVAGLTLAAPAGSVLTGITVPGQVAGLTLAAPAGSVSAGAAVTGAVAALSLAAPGGAVSTGVTTVTVTVAGSASFAFPLAAAGIPDPGTLSLPVPVVNFTGHWMFAIISWRQAPGTPPVTWSVGDDALGTSGTPGHNWWDPLGNPSGTSGADGVTRTAVWVAPAARACSTVYIAPTGWYLSVACTVLDAAGMQPWYTLTGVAAGFANSALSMGALTLGAPGAPAFLITACSSDLLAGSISRSGSGWTSLPAVTATNGTDATSDLKQTPAWQVTSSSSSAGYSGSRQDFSGVLGGVLVSAVKPGQPSPYWPVTIAEMAPGSGIGSPPDTLAWTATTARYLKMSATQGRQYELATLSTGEGTLLLDNPDGALLPPGTGSFAGITSGTPYRLRTAWPGGSWQVSFHGNGSTASPRISTGNIYPGAPGTVYSASAWLGCSPYYSSGVHLTMNFRQSGGTLISSVTSSSVTGLAAGIATVSGTAPANTALIELVIAATGTPAAAVTFYAAAVFSSGTPRYLFIPPAISWTAQDNATVSTLAAFAPDPAGPPNVSPWYIPFSGFLERLPQSWDELLRGKVEATIVDAWAGVNYVPNPILIDEIQNDDPGWYWPCTDPAGSQAAANQAQGNQNPLFLVRSKYGAGSATEAFGGNSSAILGAQGTLLLTSSGSFRASSQSGMWGQVVTSATAYNQGYGLQCLDTTFPSIADGITIEGWFQIEGIATSAALGTLLGIAGTSQDQFITFTTGPDVAGGLVFGYTTATGASAQTGVADPGAGNIFQLVVTLTQDTYEIFYNGAAAVNGSFSSPIPPGFTYLMCSMLGVQGAGTPIGSNFDGGAYSGFTGHVAVWDRILSQQRINTHWLAGSTALAGEASSGRIERLLQAGQATGRRVILQEAGTNVDAVVSCQDISGSPASQDVANITTSLVPAVFYITPPGEMYHLAKQFAWNQPVVWVLGQDVASGQIPFRGDLVFDWDPTRIVNEIQLTQLDDQSVTVPSVTAEETASQLEYGTISYQQTGYLENDSLSPLNAGPGLTDLADYLATTFAAPRLRLSAITVEASSNPTLWPFVLGVSPGDMITVNRVAQNDVIVSVTGRVTQTDRTFESGMSPTASVSLLIDPAPEGNTLQLDDPVNGLLNGANCLGW